MPLSQHLADITRLDLRNVPATPRTLGDLRERFHMLDGLLDKYEAKNAEPPADLLRDHAEAERAYTDAWCAYCAANVGTAG